MNKIRQNKFLKIISSLRKTGLGFALGAFFVLGIFVYTLYSSAAWTNPTTNPTGGNVTAPIYVGTSTAPVMQTRYGTLKLGTTTPSVASDLYVYNGSVSIATTSTNTGLLAIDNLTGTAVNAAGGYITGVESPFNPTDAVNKAWADARYTLASSNLWGGNLAGDISNNNTGKVGIGTASPNFKLTSAGPIIAYKGVQPNFGRSDFFSGIFNDSDLATLLIGQDPVNGYAALSWYYNAVPANGYLNISTANNQNIIISPGSGRVGIGTPNPGAIFHVYNASGAAGDLEVGRFEAPNATAAGEQQYLTVGNTSNGGYIAYMQSNASLGLGLHGSAATINIKGGNVGIGTAAPGAYKLNVAGDVFVSGQITAGPGDVAEEFFTDKDYPAGTVLVMDNNGYKSSRACNKEYDSTVIGVISEQPGMVIGRIDGKHKAPVALTGVIKVRINDAGGKIRKGDLLTTSSMIGEAMKAAEPKIGTIIGKALEDDSDKGWIMALVNLK